MIPIFNIGNIALLVYAKNKYRILKLYAIQFFQNNILGTKWKVEHQQFKVEPIKNIKLVRLFLFGRESPDLLAPL